MTVSTNAGNKFYVSTTATPPATYDSAGYTALTYAEVGEITDLGTLSAGAAADLQQESVLTKMIEGTSDPVVKQALQNQLTTLAIKKVQRTTNTNQ